MKFLPLILIVTSSFGAGLVNPPLNNPSSLQVATQAEVNAGIVSNKAITPLTLAGSEIVGGGITLTQATNVVTAYSPVFARTNMTDGSNTINGSITSAKLAAGVVSTQDGNTIYVMTNGVDSNNGRCLAQPVLTISNAVRLSHSGDCIEVYPGTYTESTNVVMVRDTALNFHPGSVMVSTTFGTKAALCPADNCTLNNVSVVAMGNPGLNSPALPIGCGTGDIAFTNVTLFNPRIVGDYDCYGVGTAGMCQWTLINPVAFGAYDCFISSVANNKTILVNPLFTATNITAFNLATKRGVSCVYGDVTVIGGKFVLSDIGDSTPVNGFLSSGNNGVIHAYNTVIDTSMSTNDNAYDVKSSATSSAAQAIYLYGVSRWDGKPLSVSQSFINGTFPIVGPSIAVGSGTTNAPSIYAIGLKNTAANSGFYFPFVTNVAFSSKSNQVWGIDGNGYQTNGNKISIGTNGLLMVAQGTAPKLTLTGCNIWTDGTNLCTVIQNSAGVLTTNSLVPAAWPYVPNNIPTSQVTNLNQFIPAWASGISNGITGVYSLLDGATARTFCFTNGALMNVTTP